MSQKALARRIAIGFFFFWLIVLLAGADKPPPPGFIVFVIFDIGAAIVVNYRMPTYMVWHKTRKKFRWLHVLIEGFAAGFFLALLAVLLPGGGEPSVQMRVIDYLIWFGVVGIVGVFNSVAIYGISALLTKTLKK